MKALFFEPGEPAEIMEVDDFEETLGGPVDYFWPFEDEMICAVVLADREGLQPNRVFEECGVLRGPILMVGYHDEMDDLTEEDIDFIESNAAWAEEEYGTEEFDPFEEDVQDEEDYGGVRIVGEDEFYASLLD